MKRLLLFLVLLAALPADPALAVAPSTMSYQGVLTDNAGVLVQGGSLGIVGSDVTAGVSSPLGSGGALGVSTENASTVRLRNSRVYAYTSNVGFHAAAERSDTSSLLINDTLLSGPIVGTPTCISVFSNQLQARTC